MRTVICAATSCCASVGSFHDGLQRATRAAFGNVIAALRVSSITAASRSPPLVLHLHLDNASARLVGLRDPHVDADPLEPDGYRLGCSAKFLGNRFSLSGASLSFDSVTVS